MTGRGVSHITVLNMTVIVFVFCVLHLPGLKGASDTKQVTQTPSDMIKKTDESVNSEISCSHSIQNFDRILWYKQDRNKEPKLLGYLNEMHPYPEDDVKGKISFNGDGKKGSELTVSNLTLEDSGVYFCAARGTGGNEAYFGAGTKLTVLENEHNITPPKVTVLRPSAKECRDPKDNQRKKTLVCVATGFYPDHVTVSWKINDENVPNGVATDAAALPDGKFYKTTSRLRVSAEDWFKPDNKFTCIVNFFNGTQYQDYKNSVDGVKAEDGKVMTREKYLRISQNAKLSYGVFIVKSCIYGAFVAFLVWKLQGSAGKWSN